MATCRAPPPCTTGSPPAPSPPSLSGAPSTLHALATRSSPLEATLAAGTLLAPRERRPLRLALAAVPVHLALSLGWALVLAAVLPRRRTIAWATLAGLAIAALDLGVVGRRHPRVRALAPIPQVLDHVAFGAAVGAVLSARRRSRASRRAGRARASAA